MTAALKRSYYGTQAIDAVIMMISQLVEEEHNTSYEHIDTYILLAHIDVCRISSVKDSSGLV